jgi:preprotein translocase subunit Sec63
LQVSDIDCQIYFRLVHKSASERDIKQAYKRLSRKYHPDKNKDPGAHDRFVDIAHGEKDSRYYRVFMLTVVVAYDVLSDPTVSI